MTDSEHVLLTKNGAPESHHGRGHGVGRGPAADEAAAGEPLARAAVAIPGPVGPLMNFLASVHLTYDGPHPCGTPATPACPPPPVLLQAREALIKLLAGPDTTAERQRAIMALVDSFTTVMLTATSELVQQAGVEPPAPAIEIEIVSGIAHITVEDGVEPAALAAVLEAFTIRKVAVDGIPVRT